ncbi:hypothetical protein SDC9_202528 [bioreactor metagenome]|uniref:Uncharacterized protein n=1 Tax=bioreactor metagenome TaxID=1076179 RepID=A0A645IVE4_9ZZZZ
MDKDVETVFPLPQGIIGAAAHNNAGAFLRKLADSLALGKKHLVGGGERLKIGIEIIEKTQASFLFHGADKVLRKSAFLRRKLDEFFIIKGEREFLSQFLTDDTPARTVFAGNGNDGICHFLLLLLKMWGCGNKPQPHIGFIAQVSL